MWALPLSVKRIRLASHLDDRQLIVMQKLEASNQLERKDLKKYALSSLFIHCFGLRLPRHVHYVRLTYLVLELSEYFLLSAHFLAATSYKCMRLTTSVYGIIFVIFGGSVMMSWPCLSIDY